MAGLLAASAFFSSSETALLSLQRETVIAFAEGTSRRGHLVAKLLERQRDLLATILFGNLVVNVLFYATSSLFAYRAAAEGRPTVAAAVGLGGLLTVIVFGEVVPKTVALTFNKSFAQAVAIPLYGFFTVVGPLTRAIGPVVRAITNVILRVIRPPGRITRDELSMLVEATRSQGHIPPHEGEMIEEVMSLSDTRVRDVMVPRVDLVACDAQTTIEELIGIFVKTRRTKIPVYDGDVDNVIGIAYVKSALLGNPSSLADVMGPGNFIPEAKIAEDLLYEFQQKRITAAVVVDEYGGTAGIVTLADVAQEIVGPIGDEYEAPEEAVEEVSPGTYRLAGDLSIKDWESLFDINVEAERLSTLGGFIILLLGRMPRAGDTVVYQNVSFTVEEVRKHRIVSVVASVVENGSSGAEVAP